MGHNRLDCLTRHLYQFFYVTYVPMWFITNLSSIQYQNQFHKAATIATLRTFVASTFL